MKSLKTLIKKVITNLSIWYREKKYPIAVTILFAELLGLVYIIIGTSNIISITFFGIFFLLYIETMAWLCLVDHRLTLFYVSILVNLIALSFYVCHIGKNLSLFLVILFFVALLLILNIPVLACLSKLSVFTHYIKVKLWPNERKSTLSTRFVNIGLTFSIVLLVCLFCLWSANITQDYPENYLEQICIHEAGHAVIAEKLFPESVSEVVCNPKVTYEFLTFLGFDNISLGYTRHSIERDFLTLKTTKDNIKMMLAGEAATKYFYKDNCLAGGASDIPQALILTKKYLTATYTDKGIMITNSECLDEVAKQCIDSIIPETEELIAGNSELIQMVAKKLAEDQRIPGNELRKMLKDE